MKTYPGRHARHRRQRRLARRARLGTCSASSVPTAPGKTTSIEIMEGILGATSGVFLIAASRSGVRFKEEAGILFQKTALQDFLPFRQSLNMFRGPLFARGLDVDEVIRPCALKSWRSATRANSRAASSNACYSPSRW